MSESITNLILAATMAVNAASGIMMMETHPRFGAFCAVTSVVLIPACLWMAFA